MIFERDLILVGRAELWPEAFGRRDDGGYDSSVALLPILRDQVESLMGRARRILSPPVKTDFFGLFEQARKKMVSALDDREDLLAVFERWNVVVLEGDRKVDWLVWDGLAATPVPILSARLRMELGYDRIVRVEIPVDVGSRPVLLRAHELVPRTDPPSPKRPLSWGQLRAIGAVFDEHHIGYLAEATTRRGLDRVLHDRGLKVGRTGILEISDPDVPSPSSYDKPTKQKTKTTRRARV